MRNLRDELDRRPLWGAFIGSNSALAAEFMAQAGFDWLVIDLQHAPAGGSEQLAAMPRATGSTPTLGGLPWETHYGKGTAALDAGAQGLIVPMLDTPDEAARIAGACRYPSVGYRSFGPWRAALQIPGSTTDDGDQRVLCLVQIETRAAIDNLDAIVAVPGIDGAYIGPTDLSLSHGGGVELGGCCGRA